MGMKNSEGYPDPTVDKAFGSLYHTNGRLDYSKFRDYEELINYMLSKKPGLKTKENADRYIRENMPKESYFQRKIIEWINGNVPNCIVWKEAAGPYSRHGLPDITCIVGGRYYGFEVKRPFIGKLSEIQRQTIADIRAAGGQAYVVSFPIEVANILLPEINRKKTH